MTLSADSDWQKFFGFGDLQTNPKVYIQPINSVQALAPVGQITKIQPSTSSGLVIGTLTVPWTGFQGVLQFMSNSSAVINMSSSVVGGNIQKGLVLIQNQPIQMLCDGTNWWAIGPSSSN